MEEQDQIRKLHNSCVYPTRQAMFSYSSLGKGFWVYQIVPACFHSYMYICGIVTIIIAIMGIIVGYDAWQHILIEGLMQ